ncbi:calcium-binding and coiled-coil domain-containing protein 2 isoformX2 [Anopheles sinensis]|uniref:Calcium-binding and coiled-coil domain-containing protein 2 isoformX2 n=1 Tax=Anopheles sinensis TaxID=74873 RepID=A0A084VJJ3_ANOSI|nr:calcium-binding and coiled-coil domain-containing protein 2 isoformX2 [Anopheles sinensis]
MDGTQPLGAPRRSTRLALVSSVSMQSGESIMPTLTEIEKVRDGQSVVVIERSVLEKSDIPEDEDSNKTVVEAAEGAEGTVTDADLRAQMQELQANYEILTAKVNGLEEALKRTQEKEGDFSSLDLEIKSLRKENRGLKKANERLVRQQIVEEQSPVRPEASSATPSAPEGKKLPKEMKGKSGGNSNKKKKVTTGPVATEEVPSGVVSINGPILQEVNSLQDTFASKSSKKTSGKTPGSCPEGG